MSVDTRVAPGQVRVEFVPLRLCPLQRQPRERAAAASLASFLRQVICGTELTGVQDGVPQAIPVEMCCPGWQESLAQLGKLVEPVIADQGPGPVNAAGARPPFPQAHPACFNVAPASAPSASGSWC